MSNTDQQNQHQSLHGGALHVSVVVPAYNAAGTIAETLESLLAQTHLCWEAIVVDDGSTDNTWEVAARFASNDDRIRVVRRANGGESAARNTGIGEARFDWLLFLDADDWIAPTHLERLTTELALNSKLDAVLCQSARVAPDGTHFVEAFLPPAGDLFCILAKRAAFNVHSCVVRKKIVDEVGRFDTTLKRLPDWDLWQRVARTGATFGTVPEVLAYYRMRPSSLSLDAHQMLQDGLRVLKQGHLSDGRIRNPHPSHKDGLPFDGFHKEQYYFASWCGGLLLGTGNDARQLLELLDGTPFPELYPDAVAECLFYAGALPTCKPPHAWEELWSTTRDQIASFLIALEEKSRAPDFARMATTRLKQLILRHSRTWHVALDDLENERTVLREDRDNWLHLAKTREKTIAEWGLWIHRLQGDQSNWQSIATERQELIAQMSASNEHLRQECESLRSDRDLLRARSDEQLSQLANDNQSKIDGLTLSINHLRRQVQVADEERALAIRTANECKSAIDALKASVQRLEVESQRAERERDNSLGLAAERLATINQLSASMKSVEQERDDLQRLVVERDNSTAQLQQQLVSAKAECYSLQTSSERQAGDLLLNRMHLRQPVLATAAGARVVGHRLETARLAIARQLPFHRKRLRVLATICSNFPIYSQTFVHQELKQLTRQGFDLRIIYSKLDPRSNLSSPFADLWPLKRRLILDRGNHARDFAHYKSRMPAKVQQLVDKLRQASGLSEEAILSHDNFLQAFSFTRMAEAYRPHYIHSYFFYDRSLMALVAGWLLDIPRGVSCYADHVLKDYELKVVPLHMELCNIVIATSQRIKHELLAIAPNADPDRILVKPNGIDTECFPVMQRHEPAQTAPFRIVSVCRIEPKKGLLDLVDAVHLLRERGLPIEAHLVGAADDWSEASRNYKNMLDQRISELNLWGTVHLEGKQNHAGIERFLRQSQLFVAPFVETETGDKDGIPTAVLEGMSTGLPVIATTAGSIPEVISDGDDGLLIPQRDPVAMAAAIEGLLRDPDRRHRLGRAGTVKIRSAFDVRVCEKAFHDRVYGVINARSR